MDMDREVVRNTMNRVAPVLQRLEYAGYRAYLVGGCVRDMMLAEAEASEEKSAAEASEEKTSEVRPGSAAAMPADLDVATSARPEQVKAVFGELTVIDTGIKHGTVTVLIPTGDDGDERIPVEVTTFRSEGEYSDGRHPDEVMFVPSVEEDLARRDLTINAMAMGMDGKIVDPFGGSRDLNDGIIRAVGDPAERFREDGLRIIRALRFAAVLGFDLEEGTKEALLLQKELLKNIAAERIFAELKKTLTADHVGKVLREYAEVFEVIMPELTAMRGFIQHNPYHRYDVLEHCIRTLETIETRPENREYMKFAALLHDVGKPSTFSRDEEGIGHFYGHPGAGEKICRQIMDRLRSDRATKDSVCTLVKYHDLVFEENDRLLKRWMGKFGPERLQEILALKRSDNIATGNATTELIDKFDNIRNRIEELIAEEACFRREDLAINGRDLINEGTAEGPKVGLVLDHLLDKVIDGTLKNERQALIDEARRITV